MKHNLGFIATFLVSRASALDHGNEFKRGVTSRASATACRAKLRCKFNSNDLKLEDDATIQITVKQGGRTIKCNHSNKGKRNRWYGNCDGDARDANFVKRIDRDGNAKVYGSIRVGTDICQIAPNESGEGEIKCTPESDFEDEEEPLVSPEEDEESDSSTRLLGFGYTPSSTAYAMRGSATRIGGNQRRLYDDSGANIDIMVVWTNDAECLNSGLAKGCILTPATETNMRGLVDLAIAETNTAFDLSGIFTELRLVHAYRDPAYIEPTTTIFSTALTNLREKSDGKLDSVHAKRTLYGADAVHMIIGSDGSCGIGYSGGISLSYMFSVSRYSCATGYYSLGHEFAHNMNAMHDRGTSDTCKETTTYNYGYRDPKAAFRSILAYECAVGQCDNMPANNGCSRVQRFSNSKFLYNNNKIGSATQDNARQLNENRSKAASFYPAMNCRNNSECNDNDPGTVDTCNLANAVCVFKPGSPPKPTAAPRPAVTAAPVTAPTIFSRYYMESKVVTGVKSTAWTNVSLVAKYLSPITVCTVQYDSGTTIAPAVVRMRYVGPTSFQIRLQNPGDLVSPGARDVHCVVVEEGSSKLPDCRKIEAKKYLSNVTDSKASWKGQAQKYVNFYTTAPVVLGQVMSFNDPKWSVFWCRGSDQTKPPSFNQIFTGKHVGEDTNITRAAETVGYIVIETGHATSTGIEIETRSSGNATALGYIQGNYTYNFTNPFSTIPAVVVMSQVAMRGTDGSWAVLKVKPTKTSMKVAVDEDQISDNERVHIDEKLNYAVFSAAGSVQLFRPVS